MTLKETSTISVFVKRDLVSVLGINDLSDETLGEEALKEVVAPFKVALCIYLSS